MRLSTPRFGEVNYTDKDIITFPEGIIGLESNLRYLILRPPESKPFLWLQSVDDPQVALPVIPPDLLIPDYQVDLTAQLKAALQVDKNEKVDLYCIVYSEKEPKSTTVNLLTPIVVNSAKRLACQVMVEKKPYTSRHNLFELLSQAKS